MARETKVGLVLILILMGTFGFVVWKKLDKRRQELAVARESALQADSSTDEPESDGHSHASGDRFAAGDSSHGGAEDAGFAQHEPPQQSFEPPQQSFEPGGFDQAGAPAQSEPVDFQQPRQVPEPQRLEEAPFGVAQSEPSPQAPPAQEFQPAADNWSGNGQQSFEEQPFNPGGGTAAVSQQPAGNEFAQREAARPIQEFDENPFGGEPAVAQNPPQAVDQFEPAPGPADFERPPGQLEPDVTPATAQNEFDPASGFPQDGIAQTPPAGPAQQTGFETSPPQPSTGSEFDENPFGGSEPEQSGTAVTGGTASEFGGGSEDVPFGQTAGGTVPQQQNADPLDQFEPVPDQAATPPAASDGFDPFDGSTPAKSGGAGVATSGNPAADTAAPQASPVPDIDSGFPPEDAFPSDSPTQQVGNQVPGADPRYGDYRPVPFDGGAGQTAQFDPSPRTQLPAAIGDQSIPGNGQSRPRVYEVQSGDNYWRIARSQLGDARYYMALAQYNAHRIPDPKRLKPRMKVLIPTQAELYRRFPKTCPVPEGMAANGQGAGARLPGFFVNSAGQPMYRIGAEDTLTHIAHRHLGRTSRWTQIYELNRDKLPSPNTLKIGMELRLPADASRVSVVGTARANR